MASSSRPGSARRPPVPRASLADQVARTLGGEIVAGAYQPGDKLPTEPAICRRLGVGRNVVREAIKTLAGKQFVRTDGRAGTSVLPRDDWNVLDADVLAWSVAAPEVRDRLIVELTTLRRLIEPEVAAIAARQATLTEMVRLFEAFEAMQAKAHDRALAVEADVRFHMLLFQATHNHLLISLSRAVFVLLRANFEIAIQAGDAFIRNLDEHREIAEAVHRRDPEAARQATLRLLDKNQHDLAEMSGRLAGQ